MLISKNEIKRRALEFSKEWEMETSEDAEAKTFWDQFFNVFGVSRKRVGSFEYNVKKIDGSNGFIDVFWKGVMLAEHKSRGRDLSKAFTQAKEYIPGIKNDEELPKYIVVSDFEKMIVYDLEKNTNLEFLLKDLSNNIEVFNFISGYNSSESYAQEEIVSKAAAILLADFHNELQKTGYSGHDLEVFLIRVLFCLFADDTGIFEKGLFRSYVEKRTNKDGSDLGMHLQNIFQILNTPREKRQTNIDEQLNQFPYVNGGVFSENISIASLDLSAYFKLIKCCEFNWSSISAAIFGAMFQGVMNEKQRRELGAHYTSEINILKVMRPLLLDDLYIEFDKVKYDLKKLTVFHEKLTNLKFLDPACGCGNFLVTTYRELRKLELQVLKKKRKNGQTSLLDVGDISKLNVNQFYGIEIEEFPSMVARVAMYLADHQMNMELSKEFGMLYDRMPLREPAHILNANALDTDWNNLISKNELSYIIGNPPFIGARIMTLDQKNSFEKVFEDSKKIGNLDFVCAWYEKSAKYMQDTKIKTALVSTNSITQGEQVNILWKRLKEKYGVVIHFAHQTFKWSNEASGVAAVYCVIIGFATYNTENKYLYEYENVKSEPVEKEVENINAYLVPTSDIFIENRSNSLCVGIPKVIFGNMPNDGGNFLFTELEKDYFLKIEPKAREYFKEIISAKEFLNGEKRYCLWLKNIEPNVLKNLPKVLERVENVRKLRIESRRKETQELALYPTLFAEVRQPNSGYIFIPRVSSENRKYIPMGFCSKDQIVSDTGVAVVNASLYDFGILTSSTHMLWVNYTCGRLKSDYRYSKDIVYNNFPWPENVSDENKNKIEILAKKVLDVRNLYLNTSLADMYNVNTMPPELSIAHNDLDKAVEKLYNNGKTFKDDITKIEFLFNEYKKLANV